MKKKIIVLFLIFFFSFGLFSIPHKEEPHASSAVIGYALFKAGVSFASFATFAQLFYVNGYHMQISDLLTAFADKHYNYANGVYVAKDGSLNLLEKLSLYTSAVLSGNVDNILTQSELNDLKSLITEDYPMYIDPSTITSSTNVIDTIQLWDWSTIKDNTKKPNDDLMNQMIKVSKSEDSPYYFYINTHVKSIESIDGFNTAEISLVFANGEVLPFYLKNPYIRFYGGTASSGYDIVNSFKISGSNQGNVYIKKGMPTGVETKNYQTTPGSYSAFDNPFVYSYPNYYKLLNGLATSVDDLKNLINADEYLQKEILKMLEEKTLVNEENTAIVPSINADGTIYYPGTQDLPDDPVIPYNPGSAWYNDLIGWVASIPDVINTGLDNFWDNNLSPGIDIIKGKITEIPIAINDLGVTIKDFFGSLWDTLFGFLRNIVDILTAIKDWLLGLGDFLISLIVPLDFDWATFFDPVITAFNDKFAPILTPISEIAQGLHGEDLEDIYVNIDTPMFKQRVKVISYDSIKSVRDTVQWVVRAFFWILILLFNIDQLYRLIRNQSLFNTYVHRLEAQYKEDNPAPKQQPLITYLHRK